MDALVDSARRRESVLVVGLDPIPDRLPPEIADRRLPEHESVREFCLNVLETVEPEVAAIKLQAAYFERLGPAGMEVYAEVSRSAAELNLPVIADVKRGDIGSVAAAYAEAHLKTYGARCVTVNPYMGEDAVIPFLEEVRHLGEGGGVFVLIATSNPSAEKLQNASDPPLFEIAAKLVAELGQQGKHGYPDCGGVVGATRPEAGRRVRELLPEAIFLVPGYGAQGGGAREVRSLLNSEGSGVLVNSSRAITYAHEKYGSSYPKAIREAAREAKQELRSIGARM